MSLLVGNCIVHLKPRAFENLDAMARDADLFAEARGGMFSHVIKDNVIVRAQRKVNLKVSRAESLKLNVVFAENGIYPLDVIRILIGNKRTVGK